MSAMAFEPAASVMIVRPAAEGFQVAMLERNPSLRFLGGFWVFAGGRQEADEQARECAAREAAEECGLRLDPGALLPAGRWKVPPYAPLRYDTRFFLARVSADATLTPDGQEITRAEWLRPGEVLERWASDAALLAPPTRVSLEALAAAEPDCEAEGWLERCAAAVAASHPAEGEWPGFIDFRPGLRMLLVRTPTIPPATHTNCLVVGCGSELVVIDPASPYPEERARLDALLDELAARGQRVREVLLTHHHPDHCSGAEHLARRLGVPIAAHANTWARLEGRVPVDRPIEDGERIELPADLPGARPRRLRAILTEGHADGHLVFLEEETQSLIAGDMVAGVGTIVVDPPEGRMGEYLRSLRRVADLDARLLYPSHGPPIGDPRAYAEHYIAHRLERERKVLAALEELGPCSVVDLVPRAYDDKPPQVYPLAARAALAHLEKLAEDGRAQVVDEEWALVR